MLYLLASLYILGSFVGTLGGGIQTQYLGRKITMRTANVVILCGFLFTYFGYSITMLYIGRLLIGYSNGLWTQSAPVYTGEISQPKLRKFTGSFFAMSFVSLVSFVISCVRSFFRYCSRYVFLSFFRSALIEFCRHVVLSFVLSVGLSLMFFLSFVRSLLSSSCQ